MGRPSQVSAYGTFTLAQIHTPCQPLFGYTGAKAPYGGNAGQSLRQSSPDYNGRRDFGGDTPVPLPIERYAVLDPLPEDILN